MHLLIALLVGAALAGGSAVVLVHDNTTVHQAPVNTVYNYGSGG
jgi:hypothetical protein